MLVLGETAVIAITLASQGGCAHAQIGSWQLKSLVAGNHGHVLLYVPAERVSDITLLI